MGIVTSNAWITLYGENFSPSYLIEQTGLSFSEVIEKDTTILSRGLYRGQLAPYGCAISEAIPLVENETIEGRLLTLVSELSNKVGDRLNDFRVDRVEVNLLVRYNGEGQHGYGLESRLLFFIGQLGANLLIDYEGLA